MSDLERAVYELFRRYVQNKTRLDSVIFKDYNNLTIDNAEWGGIYDEKNELIIYHDYSKGYQKINSIYKESNELGLLRIFQYQDSLAIQTPYYMLSKYISNSQGIELDLFQKILNISKDKSTMTIIGNPDSKLVILSQRDLEILLRQMTSMLYRFNIW
mgnify:CR=1 FL=1